MVDLALNEPPAVVPRELVYCRFPLGDGSPALWREVRSVLNEVGPENHPS